MTTKKYEQMNKQELIDELASYEGTVAIQDYKEDYWFRFVVDLITDKKIDPEYWASRMPEVNPYPQLIDAFVEKVNNKHLNLTDEDLQDAQELVYERLQQIKQSQEYSRDFLRQQLRSKTETKH